MMDDATRRQVQSADPERSTWVSANAGSGKTRVLTDRVARLLFRGTPPQRILCLTYTKAAASEMQVRLFRTLGSWAMAPDDELRASLSALGEHEALDEPALRRARQMFATAIETPGGLKIQTIHAFCAAVLRRFPLEAGVSPAFREIDSRQAARLRAEVLDRLAVDEAALFAEFASAAGADFDTLTAALAGAEGFAEDCAEIWRAHGISEDVDEATLGRVCGFTKADAEAVTAMARAPFEGSNDIKAARALAPLADRELTTGDLPVLEGVFLTGAGSKAPFTAKTGAVPTKGKGRPLIPDHVAQLDDLMPRIEMARELRLSLDGARRSWLLHRFGRAYSTAYAKAKALRGLLDFDDLILRTRQLLSDPAVSAWVLFGLDGGIDHVLVDEAQDTSPPQWDVVEHLTREFSAGIGARGDVPRTIFVVGDKKQSIYSFQGAEPEAFDRMRQGFAEKLAPIGPGLAEVELLHSFRSAPAILSFVDTALGPVAAGGLGPAPQHIAFHGGRPGRVDLWPVVEKEDARDDDAPWYAPVDRVSPDHPAIRLAAHVADQVSRVLCSGTRIVTGEGDRPIQARDILILVRRRSGPLFREILNRLKAAGLPVAGADQLDLETELAVGDLRALLAFLANEEDDLSLAEVLRSPLCGLSEDRLFRIAHPRGKDETLWQALRRASSPDEPARAMLEDLRRVAEFLPPFDLLDRALTRHDGRRNILARLGPEAEEGIDALLSLALSHERLGPSSISGFLSWLAEEEVKVKRQTDNAGNQIRVMTAHGAKGLESPVVILPDMGKHRPNTRGDVLLRDDAGLLWKPPAAEMDARASRAAAARAARDEEERLRLLYVSMTRAESWLILCAAGDVDEGCWYDIAAKAFEELPTSEIDTPAGPGLRFATGDWPDSGAPGAKGPEATGALPGWLRVHPPAPERPARVRSPSDLGGAKALPGEEGQEAEAAMAHGTRVHLLLEELPRHASADWPAVAANLGVDAAALAEARRVLESAELAPLFSPEALAEVDVSAALPEIGGVRVRGTIDRLIVAKDRVLIVDYKTNAVVPRNPRDVPDGLLRQMGAYAAAAGQVFPGREIETAILWTRTAELMPLPHDIVREALRDTPAS